MIFIPSISLIINCLIILVSKIFRREIYIFKNTIKTRLLSYTIIGLVTLAALTNFLFLIKFSLNGQSNLSTIIKISREWSVAKDIHAAETLNLLITDNGKKANLAIHNNLAVFQVQPISADLICRLDENENKDNDNIKPERASFNSPLFKINPEIDTSQSSTAAVFAEDLNGMAYLSSF